MPSKRSLLLLALAAAAIASLAACKDDDPRDPTVEPDALTATAQAGAVASVDPEALPLNTGKAVIDGVEYAFEIATCGVGPEGQFEIEGQGPAPDGGRVVVISFGDVEGPLFQIEVRVFDDSGGQMPVHDYLVGQRAAGPISGAEAETNEIDHGPEGLTYTLAGTFYDGQTGQREVPGALGVSCLPAGA
ncbi:MAG: hypothetical protein WD379_03365 [Dehalococcoidia bacterium]